MMKRPIALTLVLVCAIVPRTAQPMQMVVDSIDNLRTGDAATVCVRLISEGDQVAGTQNDLFWDASCLSFDGCAVNQRTGKQLNTSPPGQGNSIRALVLAFDNVDPIPDGELYCCTFRVIGQKSGCCTVGIQGALGSDPSGQQLQPTTRAGRLCMAGAPGGAPVSGGLAGGGRAPAAVEPPAAGAPEVAPPAAPGGRGQPLVGGGPSEAPAVVAPGSAPSGPAGVGGAPPAPGVPPVGVPPSGPPAGEIPPLAPQVTAATTPGETPAISPPATRVPAATHTMRPRATPTKPRAATPTERIENSGCAVVPSSSPEGALLMMLAVPGLVRKRLKIRKTIG